jgi:hypothetical protein
MGDFRGWVWVWFGRGCGVAVRWKEMVGFRATVVNSASRTGGLSNYVDGRGGMESCSEVIRSLAHASLV